ncbi:MAG: large conductance mechanosensitive channel protein MscL [Spirochaetota bacterium]
MWKEFREFAVRGNMIDMAVGIIVGVAFGTMVSSLVSDIIMPPLGMLVGDADFSELFIVLKKGEPPGPYLTLADARNAGAVTLNLGLFAGSVLRFLIVTFAVFLLVKVVNRLRRALQEASLEAEDEGVGTQEEPPAPPEEVALLREILSTLKDIRKEG